ncbi:MAG TPA: HPr kinase/phosphatase C-terminal domain-containing protein [Croceibacterium sp.]|nr:HPr kinase/phosphatase C-terminal domain-containing protein [Croceibacterium sp.]
MPGPDAARGVIVANVSCVAIGERGVLIEGEPGSGKSSLALALIDRGSMLVGDDGVTLEIRDGRLWALPPPNIPGLIEVRNVGLVTLPACAAPLALVIQLDPAAPRFIDSAEPVERAGHSLPLVALDPASPVLPLLVEYALKTYGLG